MISQSRVALESSLVESVESSSSPSKSDVFNYLKTLSNEGEISAVLQFHAFNKFIHSVFNNCVDDLSIYTTKLPFQSTSLCSIQISEIGTYNALAS